VPGSQFHGFCELTIFADQQPLQILIPLLKMFVVETFLDPMTLNVGHGVRALAEGRRQALGALSPSFPPQGHDQTSRLNHVLQAGTTREVFDLEVKDICTQVHW
jgi:hypothetical protein